MEMYATVFICFFLCFIHTSNQAEAVNNTYRVTTILEDPFVRKGNAPNKFLGLIPDLLNLISDRISVNFVISHVVDNKYGTHVQNGSWNGMIGELQRKEADIAAASLTVTSPRIRVVKFSHPFLTTGLGILMKKNPESPVQKKVTDGTLAATDFLFMFKVIKIEIWIVMVVAYVIMSLLFCLINRVLAEEKNRGSSIGDSLFQMLTILSLQAFLSATSRSSKILAGFWFLFLLLFMVAYISSATYCLFSSAFSTTEVLTPSSSIRSFKDLSENGNVQYGALPFGATRAYFKVSKDNVDQAIYRHFANFPDQSVRSQSEGVKRVQDSKDGSYAFIGESIVLKYIASTDANCNLIVVGESRGNRDFSFACSKSTDICDEINYAILTLREDGQLSRLFDKWMSGPCFKFTEDNRFDYQDSKAKTSPMDIEASPVGIETFVGPIILLIVGICLSILVMALDKFGIIPSGMQSRGEDDDTAKLEMRN